jgi:hypothetical protein
VIPGVLHQVWLGDSPFPEEFRAYQQSWLQHHPDWTLRFWTEETLPEGLREEVYDRRRSPTERSDLARLELVWRFGGIYVDTDFECLRPLTPLLEGVEFFTAYLKPNARVNNAVFGATPEHPLLERALREARPQEIGKPFDKKVSGALFFDALVRDAPGVTKFAAEDFYPQSAAQRERAFADHHAARSWKNLDEWRETALVAEGRLEKEREEHQRTKAELERLLARLGRQDEAPRAKPVAAAGEAVPLNVLFFLRGIHFSRMFEHLLRSLLERGHRLHIALSVEKRGLGADKSALFKRFSAEYPDAFAYELLPERRDRWLATAVGLRHSLDYLRYLEPEYADARPLRERARERTPWPVRGLLRVPGMRTKPLRHGLAAALRRVEAAVPVPGWVTEYVKKNNPDVVLVAPLVGLGSTDSDYLRAAADLGVPTVLPVASWDNLTNKGLLHDTPTLTIVWNDLQVEEAVRLHGVPRDRVVAVGAHSFDHWFDWEPRTTREEFAEPRGLDPERPLVVYLGSSFFITGDETVFMREWLERIRAHARLDEVAVLFRPHPYNVVGWSELEVEEPGKAVIWPKVGVAPTDDEKRAEFYDTLYHSAAVVGLNTSAQIEAAIVGRPVLTLVSDHFETQEGTLHFGYIADSGDGNGFVRVARTWQQHLDQVADAIDHPQPHRERGEAFLQTFVRPHGVERPSAPAAVDAVERAAHTAVAPRRTGVVLPALLRLLGPVLPVLRPIFQPRRTAKLAAKQVRRWIKQVRKARKNFAKARKTRRRSGAAAPPAVVSEPQAKARTPSAAPEIDRKRDRKAARAAAKSTPEPGEADLFRALMHPLDRAEARAKDRDKARERGPAAEPIARKPAPAPKPAKAAAAPERRKPAKTAKPPRKKSRKAALTRKQQRMAKRLRRRWKYAKRDLRTVYNRRYRFTYSATIRRLPSRNELPALLNARDLKGVGAEIGVKTGGFSEHLLRRWRCSRLISIDPWFSVSIEEYDDRSNVTQDEFDVNYQTTRERLEPYGSRSEVWRMRSVEAAERIPDGSLDFVYIDARHDYESVLEDLDAWFSKVKPGGIIAGHDYADGDFPQGRFGVKSAVDEFFARLDIPVHATEGPSAVELFPSWVVEVPHEGTHSSFAAVSSAGAAVDEAESRA